MATPNIIRRSITTLKGAFNSVKATLATASDIVIIKSESPIFNA